MVNDVKWKTVKDHRKVIPIPTLPSTSVIIAKPTPHVSVQHGKETVLSVPY